MDKFERLVREIEYERNMVERTIVALERDLYGYFDEHRIFHPATVHDDYQKEMRAMRQGKLRERGVLDGLIKSAAYIKRTNR